MISSPSRFVTTNCSTLPNYFRIVENISFEPHSALNASHRRHCCIKTNMRTNRKYMSLATIALMHGCVLSNPRGTQPRSQDRRTHGKQIGGLLKGIKCGKSKQTRIRRVLVEGNSHLYECLRFQYDFQGMLHFLDSPFGEGIPGHLEEGQHTCPVNRGTYKLLLHNSTQSETNVTNLVPPQTDNVQLEL